MRYIDLTDMKFGRLTVIERAGSHVTSGGDKKTRWRCICDCGNMTYATTSDLRSGDVRSCGCLKRERDKEFSATHHESKTRLYRIWKAMRGRCNNPNNSDYEYYGGRGIRVCDEWNQSYYAFKEWAMKHGYRDGLSIDRIDVNGNYCAENCRWINHLEQCNNRTNNLFITHNGEEHTISEWARISSIKYSTLYYRFKKGMTGDKLFAPTI